MKVARPVRRAGRRNPPAARLTRALRLDPYIMGAFNRSALVTVVERRSRFLLRGDLPEGHDAQSVYACLIELTADLPDAVCRSLTWDQGREMYADVIATAA